MISFQMNTRTGVLRKPGEVPWPDVGEGQQILLTFY
jgi:hypothetical protein